MQLISIKTNMLDLKPPEIRVQFIDCLFLSKHTTDILNI